ncbi:MAG: hypothetical protein ACFCVK_21200 [Acidimicrobiales bacterium]
MTPDELLGRLSSTLRNDIGPAVADEYPRTQAFMASVILEKVARQLALGPHHARDEAADLAALAEALPPVLAGAPDEVAAALAGLGGGRIDAVGPLLDALYRWGHDRPAVVAALGLIRPVLRRDIDRRMEIAR